MKTPRRTWLQLLELFPGTFADLVQSMESNRHTVWQLKVGTHRKTPHELLRVLASVLAKGTADGSPTPTQAELTAAYLKEFRRDP